MNTHKMNTVSRKTSRLLPLPLRTMALGMAGLQLVLSIIPPTALAVELATVQIAAATSPSHTEVASSDVPVVSVNRTVPVVTPPGQPGRFSENPTAQEFFSARIFAEPLVPAGEAAPGENQALAKALRSFLGRTNSDDVSAITDFLTNYPQSVWRVSLLTDLGIFYRQSGYFTRAMAAWDEAWKSGKDGTAPYIVALTDRSVSEYAELNSRVGRMDRLESLFKELEGRQFHGPASEKITAAREGLWQMQHTPETSFMCGPFALGRIQATCHIGDFTSSKIHEARSTTNGFSLVQVAALAASLKMDYQMAKRSPGAKVIVPAVVNWKLGHYAALVKEENGRYLVQDPTFAKDIWVSQAALDDEASGYFLVPVGSLPVGWRTVDEQEGMNVYGKGAAGNKDPDDTKCDDDKVPSCPRSDPMAQYAFHTMLVSLNIVDTPVRYSPPRGPSVAFRVIYNQREAYQPSVFNYSNLGNRWTFGWLSYITDDASNSSADVANYVVGGGTERHKGYDAGTSSFPPQPKSHVNLVRISSSPIQYERRLPDGSKQLFTLSDGGTNPRKVFLTSEIDPAGNAITNIFDANFRIVAVKDAIGQVTTLEYGLTNAVGDPAYYLITKVTDPFGRFAKFDYAKNGGTWQLVKITDIIGVTSEFTYTNDFITSLKTPYGTTTFTNGESGTTRWLEATDPLGATEHLEYRDGAPGIASSEPSALVPAIGTMNNYLQYRNAFYWDKKAWHDYPGDYSKAHLFHFLHRHQDVTTTSGTVESDKPALESRIWRNYDGQQPGDNINGYHFESTNQLPSKIARVLDDGSSQIYQYQYNVIGKPTRVTDPTNRVTGFIYDANNIDLLQTYQMVGATSSNVLGQFTYNSLHLPLTAVDAVGQTNFFGYNAYGQLIAMTNALNETVSLNYDANGYLTNIVAGTTTQSLSTNSFTYDGYGRVRTVTDPLGYTVTTSYDAADRATNITYMDGSYQQVVYNYLDPVLQRDRNGHWTSMQYDPQRRLTDTYDNAGRHTQFNWCGCGALESLIDPMGNATAWVRDVQGRVTSKIYPDLTQLTYAYENNTSRLKSVTDAKNQKTVYSYFVDNNLKQVSYSNAVVATPSVSFTYDTNYNRQTTMTDGTGVTTYRYYDVAAGQLGAGMLSSVSNSFIGASSVVSYNYDVLGRVTNRAINGVSQQVAFDSLGRVTAVTNALGSFTNLYVGNTALLTTNFYPNGQKTVYSYLGITNDLRLQTIWNQKTDGSTLSKFDYAYDAAGNITNWTQQADNGTPNVELMQYDPVNQLLSATVRSNSVAGAILKQFAYGYDASGNRTSASTGTSAGAAVSSAGYNAANQLTGVTNGGGLTQFAGSISRQGTVTVAGTAATMDHFTTNFVGYTSVTNGTNVVPVVATDYGSHARTNNYQLVVTNTAGTLALRYDSNGNLTNDGGGITYEYDAANRTTAINRGTTNRTEFGYDGLGRRIQIIEKTNGVAFVTNKYLWCGTELCEQRDNLGSTVVKRFFGQGEQVNGTSYYFTRDHLGSVREMTDSLGAIQVRYDYDPYGNRTKTSGTLDADFGYTGHFIIASQLETTLTLYRLYRADLGRWISRDPLHERGGINMYEYVHNNPLKHIDPFGLYDYSEVETRTQFLDPVRKSAVVGPIQGLLNIRRNSQGEGEYDFGWNQHQNDTFCANGRRMNADQFGNFVAGYQGESYDNAVGSLYPALATIYVAGIGYHLFGRTKAVGDPFDLTGIPDINAGANYAACQNHADSSFHATNPVWIIP